MKQLKITWACSSLFFFFSLWWSCQNEAIGPAEAIVRKSIEAHGGMDAWHKARKLSYRKTTVLFDTAGQIESRSVQIHTCQLQPHFSGEMSWEDNETTHQIRFDGTKATKFVNGEALTDSASSQSAWNNIVAAHYVMCQPFKLLDEGAQLEYLGKDTLEDAAITDVIKVIYAASRADGKPADQWWYFFDEKTGFLVANMVHHGSTYSYIRNHDYDTATGIRFNRHRKSYMVDSLRNILYLRAEYWNEDMRLE